MSAVTASLWPKKRLRFLLNSALSDERRLGLSMAEQVSFLPMEAIGEQGQLDLSCTRDLSEVRTGYTRFFNGDVIVAKITPCFENGKGALIFGLLNGVGYGTTELHVLSPRPELNGRFLYYVTASASFRKLGEAAMIGAAGQKRIAEDFIRDYRISIPPLSEQITIADYLDWQTAKLDALIAAKERLLELLVEKRRALITRAVTRGLNSEVPLRDSGISWLGEIPTHWETPPVYSRFEVQLGKMLDEKQIKGKHLAPYLRNVDVQWDEINTIDLPEMDFENEDCDKYSLQTGDLLVCEGGDVGRCAVWEGGLNPCYYQKALHRLRSLSGRDDIGFFALVMRSMVETGVFTVNASSATIQHLTAEKLRVVRYPSPPLTEQKTIVVHIKQETAKLDALKQAAERTIGLLKERRAALIAEAVTGRIPFT